MTARAHIRTALLLALFAFLATSLAAQSAEEEWYIGKPIKDFTFSGLATVKADDLRAVVKPYMGRPFSIDPLLWEIEAKLFALDSFETIVPSALPADATKTQVIIHLEVKERPAITSIEIVGNRDIRSGEITDKILLKKGDLSNQTRLLADVEAIRGLYLEKGYNDVTVKGRFEPAKGENTVKAVFDIVEGSPTTIREIRFSGNAFASENTLRGLMKTKPQFLLDSGVYQESKIEEDKAAIVAYYTDHGYVDARVEKITRDTEIRDGRNYLVLTIYLSEGDQWKYGGLSISGNQIFTASRLQDLLLQKPGRVLSLQKLTADVTRVQDLYYENGYIFNSFERKEIRDSATKTIAYSLTITEFDKAHIESIIFKGNTKTAEYVLRRELPFEEGEVFNREKVIDGYRALMNLQYFKSVQPEFPQGSAQGLMNIVFNVEETSTADINFGLMFSGDQNFPVTGTVKWNERNFLGHGQTVGIDLEASPVKQAINLTLIEPWMLGRRWSVGITLSIDHSFLQNVLQDFLPPVFSDADWAAGIAAPDPFVTYQDYLAAIAQGDTIPVQYMMKYDAYDFSIGFTTGYRYRTSLGWLGIKGGYTPDFRYIDYDNSLFRPFEKTVRDNWRRISLIDKVFFGISLDGRDIYWNPTTGYYVGQNIGFTGGILLGDRHYIRTDTTVEGFLTLIDMPVLDNWNLTWVLAAHSSVSLIMPQLVVPSLKWQTVTDFTDLLYIDGMTVGRGWRQLYGKALWDNKVELRTPLAKDIVWAVGFFDAAALWDVPWKANASDPGTSMTAMNIDQFYFSIGFGLRFTIPQFPIRLYLAKGFQIKPNDPAGPVVWKTGDLSIGGFSFGFVISLGGDLITGTAF